LDTPDARLTSKTSPPNAKRSSLWAFRLIASTSTTASAAPNASGSGTERERPGLDQALAAVHTGDTLVVPKLDRLARSVPDARDIGDTLAKRGVSLSLGGQIYDPDDPMGKLFFNILATFAEFEVDLIRMRTREGMAVAKAQGKLKGRQPKLSAMQQRELKRTHQTGEYTTSDLGELFSVSRPTVYRTLSRTNP